jgi:histidinol-phosphate aminotransferase
MSQITIIKKLFDSGYSPPKRYEIDLSISENPLGCSTAVKEAVIKQFEVVNRYPDKKGVALSRAIADKNNISQENIILGVGANGIIQDFVKAFIKPGDNIVMPDLSFPEPAFGASALGGYAKHVSVTKDFRIDFEGMLSAVDNKTRLIFLCNPNNPTGLYEEPETIINFASRVKCPVIISEANIEYAGKSLLDYNDLPDNLVIVRSFSKIYGLAGFRIGYAICSTEYIKLINLYRSPFEVNALAQVAAVAALRDQIHVSCSVKYILKQNELLKNELKLLGFEIVPSNCSYFMAKIPKVFLSSTDFINRLREVNCNVVDCAIFPSLNQKYVRIAPQLENENRQFIAILKTLL